MKLTPEQIIHWRNVLFLTVGPGASIFSDADIERFAENTQRRLNRDIRQIDNSISSYERKQQAAAKQAAERRNELANSVLKRLSDE